MKNQNIQKKKVHRQQDTRKKLTHDERWQLIVNDVKKMLWKKN